MYNTTCSTLYHMYCVAEPKITTALPMRITPPPGTQFLKTQTDTLKKTRREAKEEEEETHPVVTPTYLHRNHPALVPIIAIATDFFV